MIFMAWILVFAFWRGKKKENQVRGIAPEQHRALTKNR